MKYLFAIIFISAIFSCSNPDFSCDYKIITATNAIETEDTIFTKDVISYGFYIDTALIKINSYEDAARGVVTMVSDGKEVKYDIKGIWNSVTNESVLENISQERVTIVICDPTTKSYAYKEGEAARGLNEVVVSLLFMPWKVTPETLTYTQSNWIISKEPDEVLPKSQMKY